MRNQAAKMNKNQLALFSGREAVEDLLYEFLKNRSPLTEQAYRQDLKSFFEFTATQFGREMKTFFDLVIEKAPPLHSRSSCSYLPQACGKPS